ncbi:MAG: hypothetical protein QF757_03795, partial [Candidatus Marinimicrobia bacterium]|nr:hypothetical protein [Candidatus Neomarinimicrobiota bacterium]
FYPQISPRTRRLEHRIRRHRNAASDRFHVHDGIGGRHVVRKVGSLGCADPVRVRAVQKKMGPR